MRRKITVLVIVIVLVIVAPPTHEWRTADEKADSPNGDDHQVDSTLGPLKPSSLYQVLCSQQQNYNLFHLYDALIVHTV